MSQQLGDIALWREQLQITANNFQLFGVGVKNLKVTYDPTFDSWSGGAEVDLPTPNKLDIAASLADAVSLLLAREKFGHTARRR